MLEELARIPVEVEYASEFRYRNPIVDERTLGIVISQSGETADTLAAMREAKRRGARTLGIVNVVGSTIARERTAASTCTPAPRSAWPRPRRSPARWSRSRCSRCNSAACRNLSILQGREIIQALHALPEQIAADPGRAREIEALAEESQARARTSCTSAAATTSRWRSRARSS